MKRLRPFKRIRNLTHEHKIELFILLGTLLLDLSFGIEKLMAYYGMDYSLVWAFVWIGMGLLVGGVALWDLLYDLEEDNKKFPEE